MCGYLVLFGFSCFLFPTLLFCLFVCCLFHLSVESQHFEGPLPWDLSLAKAAESTLRIGHVILIRAFRSRRWKFGKQLAQWSMPVTTTILGHDMGGVQNVWGEKNVPENASARKFLDPSQRASGLLCRGFSYRKNRAMAPEGGGKRTRRREVQKPFLGGVSFVRFSSPLFSPPPHGVLWQMAEHTSLPLFYQLDRQNMLVFLFYQQESAEPWLKKVHSIRAFHWQVPQSCPGITMKDLIDSSIHCHVEISKLPLSVPMKWTRLPLTRKLKWNSFPENISSLSLSYWYELDRWSFAFVST